MKIFKLDAIAILNEEFKCPECNWKVSIAYTLATSKEEAIKKLNEDVALCSECFLDMLIEKCDKIFPN